MTARSGAPPAATGRGAVAEHIGGPLEKRSSAAADKLHDVIAAVRADGRDRGLRCPAHDDRRASLSIGRGDDGQILIHCHAGCETDAVLQAAGLDWADVMPPRTNGSGRAQRSQIAGTYDYRDEAGELLYQVLRYAPKTFRQRRPKGQGGWSWSVRGVRRVIYYLPKLQGCKDACITEGEKDVDALWSIGVPATCNPGGAGKWRDDYTRQLQAAGIKTVAILPDNDDAGRKHAQQVAASCHAAGLPVRIVELSGLPPKGDVSDWLDADHGRSELMAAISSTARYEPPPRRLAAGIERAAGDTGDTGDSGENAGVEPPPVTGDALGTLGTGFRVKDSGVWHHTDDGDPQWICSPLDVTALTRNEDGEAWGRLLEFPDEDGRWHRWACPMELLAGDGTEFRRILLSEGLRIAPGGKARNLLAVYVQTKRVKARAVCTDRTGWHGGAYVLADDTIGESGERVLLQTAAEPPKMRQAGSLEDWQRSVAALCRGNSRLTLAVSAAFAAPLIELVGDESGGIHYVGDSSIGKTASLRAAASVYGAPEYLHRWRATANGLEAVATTHNDALLVLDELSQVDAREAGAVAYMLANGTGKHRARRDGLARPAATWRLLFLSAGEIGLADHMREAGKRVRAGQEVRLADVPADAGCGLGIFEALHEAASGAALADEVKRAASTSYGTPIRTYLEAVSEMPADRLAARVRDLRDEFIAERVPTGADGQAQRVAGRFALIAAGGELATQLGITGWDSVDAIHAAATCYDAWLDRRGGPGSSEDAEALATVRHFIEAHGEARFTPIGEEMRPTVNRAGFRRQSDGEWQYMILPEVFRREVCVGMDARRVARLLRDRGLLITEAPDRLTIKPRGQSRCYAVREAIHDAS